MLIFGKTRFQIHIFFTRIGSIEMLFAQGHLAPTEEELFALMDKACRESFSITLTFPFLLEENLSETQSTSAASCQMV